MMILMLSAWTVGRRSLLLSLNSATKRRLSWVLCRLLVQRTVLWSAFMMWERGYDSDMPMKLMYKYYKDEKNDAEVERRMRWEDDDGT